MKLIMKLTLFFLVIFQLCSAMGFWFEEEPEVELKPNNPKACTSQNVTLVCTSTNLAKFNASNIAFEIFSENSLEHSEKQILNESSAAMTFWNMKANGNDHVCCKNEAEPDLDDCQTIITSDDPVPVTNLTCIVNKWYENMNCTWTPGTNYTVIPEVYFEWRIRYLSCNWTPCPLLDQKHNFCYWQSTSVGDFSTKVIDIRIRVRANCGLETVTYYTVNTKTVVKPAPPSDVRSAALNSTCVQIRWTSSKLEYRKIYQLWHTSKWGTSQGIIIDTENTGKVRDNEKVICGLIPATIYDFHVRVKPAEKYWSSPNNTHTACGSCSDCSNTGDVECECLTNNGYWSDERRTSANTYGALPNASPAVSQGGYKWDPNECDGTDARRTTYLYWKPIDAINQNGVIFGYEVNLYPSKGKNWTFDVAGDRNSESRNIVCNADYTVTIQARNGNGTSPNISTFKILDYQKGIYPPQFMVEMSNVTDEQGKRTVHVQWGQVPRHDVTGYTVYMCKKEQGECAVR